MIEHIKLRMNRKTVFFISILLFMFINHHIQVNGYIEGLYYDQNVILTIPHLEKKPQNQLKNPLLVENTQIQTKISILLNTSRKSERKSLLYSEEHDPIVINGNDDFLAHAVTENWPGYGSESSPYIINGFSISDSESSAIQIRNTDIHFQISNCTFINDETGITLHNVKNGHIINNLVDSNFVGMYLYGASNNNISSNNVSNNVMEGILVESNFDNPFNILTADYNTITFNHMYNNHMGGIVVCSGNNNKITNNTLHDDGGISIEGNNSIVSNNIIYNSEGNGISLESANKNQIITNLIYGNSECGVVVASYSDANAISNNTIEENGGYGVSIEANSSENIIRWNCISNNNQGGRTQALDDGSSSFFFQNYWSDWTIPDDDSNGIVDLPYPIDGSAQNNDSFPLVTLEYEYMKIHELLNPKILYPTAGIILNSSVNIQWKVSVGSYTIETPFINLIFNIQYSIHFSSDGGENWLLFINNLTTNQYKWDTTSVPGGSNYMIKVITSSINGFAINTISGAFSIHNHEGDLNQLLAQIFSISLVVFCILAAGYYIVNTKLRAPSFIEYFQSDKIEFLKPIYHKLIIGLESIQTAIMSEAVVTPLLEEPTTPTSLVTWFPDDYRRELKSKFKGRTILTLIEIAFQYSEDANLTKLAQALDIPASTLSDELKKLVKLNYLDFHVIPQVLHDGRYRHYIITAKGISFLKILKSALELSIRRAKEKEQFT